MKDDLSWRNKSVFSLLVIALLNILQNSSNSVRIKAVFIGVTFLYVFFLNLEENYTK